jgi:hypothetical protein
MNSSSHLEYKPGSNNFTEFYMVLMITVVVGAVVVINTIFQMIFSVIYTAFTVIFAIFKFSFYMIKLGILTIKYVFNSIKFMFNIIKYIFEIMNEIIAMINHNMNKFVKTIFCITEEDSDDEDHVEDHAEEHTEEPANNNILSGYEISASTSNSHDDDNSSGSTTSGGGICNKKFIEYYQMHKDEYKALFPTLNGTQIRKALYHKLKAELKAEVNS